MNSMPVETIKVIPCRRCGKLQRLVSYPVDATGRPAMTFRMTCTRCHGAETYGVHDVVAMK